MPNRRFTSVTYTLLYQAVPGHREIRFRPAKDTSMNRPKEARSNV